MIVIDTVQSSPTILKLIILGTKGEDEKLFENICHELWEIVALEMAVRYQRQDVGDDYVFMYDHKQHTTMCAMFAGLVSLLNN